MILTRVLLCAYEKVPERGGQNVGDAGLGVIDGNDLAATEELSERIGKRYLELASINRKALRQIEHERRQIRPALLRFGSQLQVVGNPKHGAFPLHPFGRGHLRRVVKRIARVRSSNVIDNEPTHCWLVACKRMVVDFNFGLHGERCRRHRKRRNENERNDGRQYA